MLKFVVHHEKEIISSKFQGMRKVPYPKYSTDVTEMKAYIGLRYARGVLCYNRLSFRLLFQDPVCHNIFGITTSAYRFQFLN